MGDQRFKRTLLQQYHLTHENLMPIEGWFKNDPEDPLCLPSVVMPQMERALAQHQIHSCEEYARLVSGTLASKIELC